MATNILAIGTLTTDVSATQVLAAGEVASVACITSSASFYETGPASIGIEVETTAGWRGVGSVGASEVSKQIFGPCSFRVRRASGTCGADLL